MHEATARIRIARVTLAVAIVAVASAALTGCGASATKTGSMMGQGTVSGSARGATATAQVATDSTQATSGAQVASDVQTCAECNKKGMPPKVVGYPVTEAGVQVLNVTFVNGYYAPNAFTVKPGMPVRVVFTGKAKGCLAKPTFKSLGKKGDVTGTGSATVELGTLKAGSYGWTCAMGMNKGSITVQ